MTKSIYDYTARTIDGHPRASRSFTKPRSR
jgi:hypothetical protein